MDRRLTNKIRWILDECFPPVIRDSSWFMYPLFFFWFKGQRIHHCMHLKSLFHKMSPADFAELYRDLSGQLSVRSTDLTESCQEAILEGLDPECYSFLDVGCGRGVLLDKVAQRGFSVSGCDLVNNLDDKEIPYFEGSVESLPFEDNAFDIVTCCHTLEHVAQLDTAVNELKRVAAKQLIICVPKQKYFYYTLDLHLHFFPTEAYLCTAFGIEDYEVEEHDGDWVFIADLMKA